MNSTSQLLEILTQIFPHLLKIGLVASLFSLVIQIPLWLRGASFKQRAASVVPVDVTGQTTLPDTLAPLIQILEGNGFKPVGAATVTPPGRPPMTMWVLNAPDGSCHAEVSLIRNRPILLLVSMFAAHSNDPACAVTAFPEGPTVDEPNYMTRAVTSNIASAFQNHQTLIQTFQMSPGYPFRVDSMPKFLEYSRIYNTMLAGQMGKPEQRKRLRMIGSGIYDSLVFGGLIAANALLDIPPVRLVAIALPLIVTMVLVRWLLTKGIDMLRSAAPGGG